MDHEADGLHATENEDRLVELLEQVTSSLQSGELLDPETLRDQLATVAADADELVSTIHGLEDAVLDWRSVLDETGAAEQPTVDFTPDAEQPTPPTGELGTIGRFVVLGRIGGGGMGDVYRARDPHLSRQVAIKIPRLDMSRAGADADCQRFQREARAAANVRHAHVCPIHDVGEHNGLPYVVMAYVPGSNLARRLKSGKFENLREAVEIVRQAAEGLAAVHAQGIVHRDLKPGNILLDETCQAVLTDFGLARATADDEHLTGTGTLIGTPAYMAPEQARGDADRVGPASDIYSLGLVLYQSVTGKLPFVGDVLTVLRRISDETPPKPVELRPDLDPALAAIIETAMARQPEQRYASAKEFATALQQWLDGQATVVMAPTAALPAPPPAAWSGWSTTTIWVCGSVLSACLVFAVLLPTFSTAPAMRLADSSRGNTGEAAAPAPPIAATPPTPSRSFGPGKMPPTPTPPSPMLTPDIVTPDNSGLLFQFAGKQGDLLAIRREREMLRNQVGLSDSAPELGKKTPLPPITSATPLRGNLELRIWGREHRGVPIEQGLPVFNGDRVRLEATLNQPAHFYILWIDANGKVQWVTKDGKIEDLSVAAGATDTMPAVSLASPPWVAGEELKGWEIVGDSGAETALLLARKSPLPPGERIGALLAKAMPKEWPKALTPQVVWLEVDPQTKLAQYQLKAQRLTRGLDPKTKAIDDPILEFLNNLQPHFDLIQAVRFTHADK